MPVLWYCIQQWNAHFFLLTSTRLYYTDETNLISQNFPGDEDDDKEEEDNVTNSQMEVSHTSCIIFLDNW